MLKRKIQERFEKAPDFKSLRRPGQSVTKMARLSTRKPRKGFRATKSYLSFERALWGLAAGLSYENAAYLLGIHVSSARRLRARVVGVLRELDRAAGLDRE